MNIDNILSLPPYGLPSAEKNMRLLSRLDELTRFHYRNNEIYAHVIDRVWGGLHASYHTIEEVPFLPVSLFKNSELVSVPPAAVVKVLTSSGTTGIQVSKIFLDAHTAKAQSTVMIRIMQHVLGNNRRPMIIADHENVIKDRQSYSARGAGIVGILQFGRDPFFALRDDMSLRVRELVRYIKKHKDEQIVVFGFTYIVWKYFICELEQQQIRLHMPTSILLHTGGWKKLQSEMVDATAFRKKILDVTDIYRVRNYYGMVEQVGSIYMENEELFFESSSYSDVIIRDPATLVPLLPGNVGVIEVVSMLPQSYPGHALLTEDLGIIHHAADTISGTNFTVLGRVPKAELRGCSDTFEV